MKISEIIFKVSLPARTAGGHPPCSRTTESTDGGCDDGTGAEKRTRKTVKFTTEKLAFALCRPGAEEGYSQWPCDSSFLVASLISLGATVWNDLIAMSLLMLAGGVVH